MGLSEDSLARFENAAELTEHYRKHGGDFSAAYEAEYNDNETRFTEACKQ